MNQIRIYANYPLLYVIIFFWFYASADSIITLVLPKLISDTLKIIVPSLFILYILFKLAKSNKKINRSILFVFMFFLFSFTASSLFNTGISFGIIYLVSILLLVGLVVNEYCIHSIAYTFNKLMFFICIFSILLFFIAFYHDGLLSIFPTLVNSEDVKYKNLFFGAIFIERMDIRSIGIFREPGVFCVYIIIALIFELYVLKISKYHRWVYCFALILTFSSSGYFALFFIMLTYGLHKLDLSIKSLLFCLALIILTPFILSNFDFNIILGKFDPSSSYYGNVIARTASVLVNFEIIMEHPFFGVGFTNYPEVFKDTSLKLMGIPLESGTQSTNSFFAQGAIFGVFSAVLMVFLFLYFSFRIGKKNLLISSGVFFSLIIVFSSQDMRFSYIFYLILFLSLCKFNGKFSKNNML